MNPLPAYTPPPSQRACIAAGMAPLAVLLAFVAIVTRVIDADTGLAVLAASALWVGAEMHQHQRSLDRYNADYAAQHLAGRSAATLASMTRDPATAATTAEFVQRFLADGCQLRPDRPLPG